MLVLSYSLLIQTLVVAKQTTQTHSAIVNSWFNIHNNGSSYYLIK